MTFLGRAPGAGALGTGVAGARHGAGEQAEVPAPLTDLIVLLFLSDWRPALNLAALDCADETNSAVCRDFNIPGFPTVRVRDGERGAGVLLEERVAGCPMPPPAPELHGVLPCFWA